MTKEARMCVESCREWYQAFSNFGKGEERSVKELLAVADLIESLSARLDQVTRERDALLEDLSAHRPCDACGYYELQGYDCMRCRTHTERPHWKWRGVEVEDVHA